MLFRFEVFWVGFSARAATRGFAWIKKIACLTICAICAPRGRVASLATLKPAPRPHPSPRGQVEPTKAPNLDIYNEIDNDIAIGSDNKNDNDNDADDEHDNVEDVKHVKNKKFIEFSFWLCFYLKFCRGVCGRSSRFSCFQAFSSSTPWNDPANHFAASAATHLAMCL